MTGEFKRGGCRNVYASRPGPRE